MARKHKGPKHRTVRKQRAANSKYVTLPDGRVGRKIGLDEKVDLREGGEFIVAKKNEDGDLVFPAGTPFDTITSTIETMLEGNSVPRNWRDTEPTDDRTFASLERLQIITNSPLDQEIERLLRQKKLIQPHHFTYLLDQAYRANGTKEAVSNIGRTLAYYGEWFAFDDMANDFIKSESLRLKDVMRSGLVHLPYPLCVFTHGYHDTDGSFCQCFYLLAEGQPGAVEDGLQPGHYAVLEFRAHYVREGVVMFDPRIGIVTNFQAYPGRPDQHYSELLSNPLRLTGSALSAEAGSAVDPVIVMMMAVNTKNLRMQTIEPGEALVKSRAKQGKPPLRRVTRVYMHQYMAAAAETDRMASKGTHASPRPHLRRAHLRYRNHPTVSPKWIEACIVNAHKGGEVLNRDEYRVSR